MLELQKRTLNFQRSKFYFSFLRLLAFDLFGSFCKISLCAGKLSENEKLSISTETLIHGHSLYLKKKNGFEIIHNQWPEYQLKNKLYFQLWYKNSLVCCLLHSRGSGEGGHFSLWHCLFLQCCVLTAKMCNTSIYVSVLINIEDTNASQPDQKYDYAIECVFAACCEVSRWRAGGGARRQEATFQSVCSAISTPTPPLIIHKFKIQKYKNT